MLSVAFVVVKAAFHRGIEDPEEIEQLGLPQICQRTKVSGSITTYAKAK